MQDENYCYTIILSKKGLMQLVKMPSIHDFCADDRFSAFKVYFKKSRTWSGAISNSKAFIL